MHIVKRTLLRLIGAAAVTLAPAYAQGEPPKKSLISDFDVFGRVMFDYANASSDNTTLSVDETELRNARLGVSGKLSGGVKFKVELHTDDSADVIITDAHIRLKPVGAPITVQAGQFKTPNSLDEQTSSRFISVHERAAFTDAFELNRRLGVAISGSNDRTSYALGVFGQNIDDDNTFGGYALAGRVTYSPPTKIEDLNIHTGLSFRRRKLDSDEPDFRYRQRPVTHIPGRIISTGRIAESDLFVGAEVALTKGRFWAAGEYAITFADCSACTGNPSFSGGYAEAGLMIHGHRVIEKGRFGRPQIDENGLGALSLALRVDTIDLSDANIDGGSYNAYILGADWWPTDHLRLGANGFVVNADLAQIPSGLDSALADAIAVNISEDVVKGVTLRAQLDF